MPARAVVEARTIPREVGLSKSRTGAKPCPDSFFALETTSGFVREATFRARPGTTNDGRSGSAPLEEVFDDEVVKMLAHHEEHAPEDYWQAARSPWGTWSPPRGPRRTPWWR